MTQKTREELKKHLKTKLRIELASETITEIESIILKGLAEDKAAEIIERLDDYGRNYNQFEYGLPVSIWGNHMKEIVTDILTKN